MKAWFLANWGTILVSLILIGVVALIIANLRSKKKQGVSACGCGCNCANCSMGCSCHQK